MSQTKGLNRSSLDKFYTKHDITNLCYKNIKKILKIKNNELVIEPSAGNGSFISIIKKITKKYILYDINPENKEILKKDFLSVNLDEFKDYHIIGNPPFGRQSSLAIKFIKYCKNAKSISFILPKSFKKDSLKKHFPLNFHLEFQIDLPKNSFLVNDEEYDVPCVFQIWKRKKTKRSVPKKLVAKNFSFVKKSEDHDISFRRVGVYAGKIETETENKSTQSHYFVKFYNDVDIEELKNKIKFECNNTVGPKSISKQELIKEFNQYTSLLNYK